MGWPSTMSQQYTCVFRLWIRLKNKDQNTPCKRINDWSSHRTSKTWERRVKDIAVKYNAWNTLQNCDDRPKKAVMKELRVLK